MVVITKQSTFKAWMSSAETPVVKQRSGEHLPRLKPINEQHGLADKQLLQAQPNLRSSSLLPPVTRSVAPKPATINHSLESTTSSMVSSSTARDGYLRSISRNNMSSVASGSPRLLAASNARSKRSSQYDHVGPKIDTGLVPRSESLVRAENENHRLGPVRAINWRLLKQELERDFEVRAYSKRLQFNSGITYKQQLTTLGDLVRSKVKSHVLAMMGYVEERYKVVVNLTVFPMTTAGLYVASRCLWNAQTDNSITMKMHGVDCDILIIVFLCYTELGSM